MLSELQYLYVLIVNVNFYFLKCKKEKLEKSCIANEMIFLPAGSYLHYRRKTKRVSTSVTLTENKVEHISCKKATLRCWAARLRPVFLPLLFWTVDFIANLDSGATRMLSMWAWWIPLPFKKYDVCINVFFYW